MRVVFLGTPEIAVPSLRALHSAGHLIRLVVTGADKRRGRGGGTSPSPVKEAALALGLPVSHSVDDVLEVDAELGVVVAFGRIIRPHVLARVPMVNVHFSLLPRWRGAAPVERAILAGDEITGVDVMRVEEGLDTGAVYARAQVPIGPDDTAADVRAALVEQGTRLLVEQLAAHSLEWLDHGQPQVGESTYAEKLSSSELELDWSRPDVENHRVDLLLVDHLEGFFAVGCVDDFVSRLLEFESDDALVVFVVFDDEYRRSVRSEIAHAAHGDLRTFPYGTSRQSLAF